MRACMRVRVCVCEKLTDADSGRRTHPPLPSVRVVVLPVLQLMCAADVQRALSLRPPSLSVFVLCTARVRGLRGWVRDEQCRRGPADGAMALVTNALWSLDLVSGHLCFDSCHVKCLFGLFCDVAWQLK